MMPAADQAPQAPNERVLNSRLQDAVRNYGDLTLQKERIDRQLVQVRQYIDNLFALAPVASEVEKETLSASHHQPLPEPRSIAPLAAVPRKRGRPSNAQKRAEAAAASLRLEEAGIGRQSAG